MGHSLPEGELPLHEVRVGRKEGRNSKLQPLQVALISLLVTVMYLYINTPVVGHSGVPCYYSLTSVRH